MISQIKVVDSKTLTNKLSLLILAYFNTSLVRTVFEYLEQTRTKMEKSTQKKVIKTLKFYKDILKKGMKDRNASEKAKHNLSLEINKVENLIEDVKNE